MVRPDQLQSAASDFLVPLRVTAPDRQPFRATAEFAGTTGLSVGRLRCGPHRVLRETTAMSSTDPDLFKITLHLGGTAVTSQDDRQRRVRTGDLLAIDTTRPYSLRLLDPCDVVVVGVSRTLLGPHAQTLARRSGEAVPADKGLAALCAGLLATLGDHVDTVTGPRPEFLLGAMTNLLIGALTGIPPEHMETPSGSHIDRIVAYTLGDLGNEKLCVKSVAAQHRISPRRLHQLFRGRERTFTEWVRHERLERIHRDLADPAQSNHTITAIARRWGVPNTSHLARAMKKKYGYTAAELRRSVTSSATRP
ncbi:AraC family transcriptional regulator [Streptomyces odontomachi]|uniref:AraC family transcriptional regulator n=1 Tax=Streptomyces odontomachi TaxID=2944940 RepID=UPI002109CA00|nr:AraC family transcriptional regulator [Streptomyces sp. ODS25]